MKCEHTLEKIAETEPKRTTLLEWTSYLECSGCGSLFVQENTSLKGDVQIGKPRPYDGLLTRNQIMDHANKYQGGIDQEEEAKIYLEIPFR